MPRLLIVSNRLPVTVVPRDGQVEVVRSPGGLATGLRSPHESGSGWWIGWPGSTSSLGPEAKQSLVGQLEAQRLGMVELTDDEVNRYYESYANGILWPLFHDLAGRLPLFVQDFDAYEAANRKFADAVLARYRPGDLIWVHDYQLMLVPAMLRAKLPDARIGFFLHIPFPSSDVFRTLPHRTRMLEGLLGADLVGFHTAGYVRHFTNAVLSLLGVATDVDRMTWQGREIRAGVFPMGIDAKVFEALGNDPEVAKQAAAMRSGSEQLLVGIDRLDYTKGIPRRLLAYEKFLRDFPDFRGKVRLVQVAVPSRTNVEAYQEFREQIDQLIGRIHGAFATPSWVPVHYLYRSLSEVEVAALYKAADAMLVTPVRDGMNLVAKEFVATRTDNDGVLVLSEFAGAASEMADALQVNPYDVEGTAAAIHRSLTMPAEERRTRMAAMRVQVQERDVHRWVSRFLTALEQAPAAASKLRLSKPKALDEAVAKLASAKRRILLLDYDGTLVPFAPVPDKAKPDKALLALLEKLSRLPQTEVHVVSGRKRDTLEAWLGKLGIGLHAEHGYWSKPPGAADWTSVNLPDQSWRAPALAFLRDFAERTPGALVEEKTAGIAWHYRMVEPEYGLTRANELRLNLTTLLSNAPVEILPGDKVIEVRLHNINKGRVVRKVLPASLDGVAVLGMGDDRTDEDLFAALPEGAVCVHVGERASRAALRIKDVAAARAFLARLVG